MMLDYEPVFLLAGQSNMAGRCNAKDYYYLPTTPPSPRRPDNDVNDSKSNQKLSSSSSLEILFCWNNDCNFGPPGTSDGQWLKLQPQYSPGLDMDCFGPEMGIAETLGPRLSSHEKYCCNRAYFLKFAMGSTNLHSNWNPDNACQTGKPSDIGYYPTFIDFCQRSLQQLNDDDDAQQQQQEQQPHQKKKRLLAGMFWLQGESDTSKAKDANAYKNNLERFCAAVRKDLSPLSIQSNFPIVASPVVWKGKKLQIVNKALKEAGNDDGSSIPNCYCIDPIDVVPSDWPIVQTKEAGLCADHLTAPAIMDIGRRMGLEFPLDQLSM